MKMTYSSTYSSLYRILNLVKILMDTSAAGVDTIIINKCLDTVGSLPLQEHSRLQK